MNIENIYHRISLKTGLFLVGFTFLSTGLFAQEEWEKNDGEIEDVEIQIVKDREITLPKANRNFEKIPPSGIVRTQPNLEYFFSNLNLPLPALNIRVRPLRMKDEPLNKLYGNYVKAGFGNYATPYLEGYFSNKRDNQMMYGAHFNFLDSRNGPVDGKNSGSGVVNGNVFGKYFGSKVTASGEVGFDRRRYNFYGYPENQEVDADTLKQNFSVMHIQGYLENTQADAKLSYLAGFQFDYLTDNYEAKESEFQIDLNTGFDIGGTTKAEIKSDLDIISQKDALLDVKTRNIFRVNPTLTFEYGGFLINAGFKAIYENDTLGDSDEVHFYPVAKARYQLPSGFTVFAGIDGDIEKLTLRKMTNENPFLMPNAQAFNTNKTFQLYGGIEGSLSSKMGFRSGISVSTYKNMYYFLNSPLDQSKFMVVYDQGSTSLVNIYGELSYNRNEALRFILRGDYWGYDTDEIQEAYHRPNYKVSAISTYKLYDKFRFEAEAYMLGGIKAFDFNTGEDTDLDAALDLNLKAEYLFSKQFSAFIRLNNLLSNEYEVLYNYPSRGLQVLAGVTYSF